MRPSERDIRIAGALTVAAGLAACGVAIFSDQLGLGAEVARGTFGWRQISLLVVGGVVLAVGALLLARPRAVSRRVDWERADPDLRPFLSPSDRQLSYLAIGLLALLGVVLVWTRLVHIDESLWHDEAFTVMTYSGVGPGAILLGESYFQTNNHVLYNLLSWATVSLLGESEAMYRLWSVLPGMAAIGVGAWWAWRRIGRVAAVAFAAIAVAGPLHLEYVPQARGYGLALLAATLMLVAADRLSRAYSRRALLGFAGAGLLGIWTLFTFTIAFVAQAVALLRWPGLRLPVIVAVGGTGVLSLAFYAPVLGSVAGSGASGGTIPFTAALLLDRPLDWLVSPTVTLLTGGEGQTPLEWATWLDIGVLALLILGLVALWRRGEGGLALILVVPPLLFNLVLSIEQQSTVMRHQLFLLPYVVLPVATGIAELGRIAAQHRAVKPIAIGLGVAAVVALSRAIVQDEERRDLPYENFQQVASTVDGTGIDTVVTDSLRPTGLRYYLGDDLRELPPERIESLLCERRQEIVYIDHLAYSDADWAPDSLDCVLRKPSVRIRVPQRGRGSAIDVWIVDPRSVRETIEAEAAPES